MPLPEGGPRPRIETILADCDAALVLYDEAHRALVEDGPSPAMALSERGAPAHPAPLTDPLAYLLYTSGSTGQPKGVAWDHGPATAFPRWCLGRLGLSADDRVAAVAPLTFDLSTFDLFAAPMAGAAVHIAPREARLFASTMARWIEETRPTVLYAVPTLYQRLLEGGADLTSLRLALFAGEVFAPEALARLRTRAPDASLHNLYGPTETNVCTAHEVRTVGDAPAAIGRALPGLVASVLEPDEGVGELLVEGRAVMAGYWRAGTVDGGLERDEQHATGDYVRRDEAGDLHFVGRMDRRVKVRGHRVELGEVEHTLRSCPGVREVAVVLHEGALRVFYAGDASPRDLRAHAATRLPPFMVPSALEQLEQLPRTARGKVALSELGARP